MQSISSCSSPLQQGFFLGLSLIIAIGTQNLFILRQGIAGRHLLGVVLTSSLCDFAMIAMGTLGAGSIVSSSPLLCMGAVIFGIIFLLFYGMKSFWNAWRGNSQALLIGQDATLSTQRSVIMASIGFSLLNPHAFLDTVILMGGLAGQYNSWQERNWFALGAGISSIAWFFSLAYGAKLLAPIFRRPLFATLLDVLAGLIMFLIAFSLAYSELYCRI